MHSASPHSAFPHSASPSTPVSRAVSGIVRALTAPAFTVVLVWSLTTVFGLAALGPQASGQEMMRFSSDDSLMIREIGAITEMSDEGLRVVMAMPGEARPEAYRDLDVRKDDVILVVNGKRIRELATARDLIDNAAPGDEIALGIDRGGRSVIVRFPKADPASLPDKMVFNGSGGGHGRAVESRMMIQGDGGDLTPVMGLGVILESVSSGEDGEPETVKVTAVLPIGETQLAEGDILKSVGGEPVVSAAAVADAVDAADVGAEIALVVLRGDEEVAVSQPKSAARGEIRIRNQ